MEILLLISNCKIKKRSYKLMDKTLNKDLSLNYLLQKYQLFSEFFI